MNEPANLDEQMLAEVERTLAAIRADPLDKHAIEIGRLCLMWSRLEVSVTILLDVLLDIRDRTALSIIMGALDFRAKIQTVIPLAFSKKISDDWFDRLQQELNAIDNDLRPERNRMVHDFWTIELGQTAGMRIQLAPRVVKDQRTKKLTIANVKPITPNDITMLILRIARVNGALDLLREEYQPPSWHGRSPEPVQSANPDLGRSPAEEASPPRSSET